MDRPTDQSDAATLIQADWFEEYGDVTVAEELRLSVTEGSDNWLYDYAFYSVIAGEYSIGVGSNEMDFLGGYENIGSRNNSVGDIEMGVGGHHG